MDRDRVRWLLVGVALLAVLGVVAVTVGLVPLPDDDGRDRAVVTIYDEDGTELATVTAEVADTRDERTKGLSYTDSLANGSGMLFVHENEQTLTYWMRGMNYGLDMVFIGADRRVNSVAQAPAPGPDEEGTDIRRSGRARWVLEVPMGYAVSRGIDEGDRVEIDFPE